MYCYPDGTKPAIFISSTSFRLIKARKVSCGIPLLLFEVVAPNSITNGFCNPQWQVVTVAGFNIFPVGPRGGLDT